MASSLSIIAVAWVIERGATEMARCGGAWRRGRGGRDGVAVVEAQIV
jgi:hypothetical protein